MSKKFLKQCGQASVLYALLIPLLILFVGVGIDLGWYYLNVSRMQNAADAAALAGAQELVEEGRTMATQDYYVDGLVFPPTDLLDETKYNKFNVDEDGTVIVQAIEINESKAVARRYATQNLYDSDTASHTTITNQKLVADEWTHKKDVSFSAILYTRNNTWKEETTTHSREASVGARYYRVTLKQKIDHMFLGGFKPMEAEVVACAIIKPHDKDLITSIEALRRDKTIENWEYQNKYHNHTGKWNHYQDKKVHYKTGNDYRTEVLNINPSTNDSTSSMVATSANGGKKYSESTVDSINLDFRIDVSYKGKYNGKTDVKKWDFDWDLRDELPEGIETYISRYDLVDGWDVGQHDNLRVIASFNFDGKWLDRDLNDLKPDILWTKVESDPMWFNLEFRTIATLSSVRQIVMNVTESNTETTTVTKDGETHTVYKYRPFFIVYMGPETNQPLATSTRQSQPVILNLYENWNAILYMPNSPVIINGNSHSLTGFVIAKEYHRLKTIDEYDDTEYIKGSDGYSHRLIVPNDNAAIEDAVKLEAKKEVAWIETDSKGDISLYKTTKAGVNKMIINSQYIMGTNSDDSSYVAALEKYRNVGDADIVRITFPNDGYNNTRSYAVVKSDLLDTDPDPNVTPNKDNYVAVVADNETKYIAKKNLPYAKVKREGYYPYVPVCDIKIQNNDANDYAGVTLVDSNNNAISDPDAFRVYRKSMDDLYQKNYTDNKVYKVIDEDDGKYFILKSDIKDADKKLIKKFTKITTDDNQIYYVDEDNSEHYMEVVPEGSLEVNKIIVDRFGDLQSVRITPSEVLNVTNKAQNDAVEHSSDETISKYLNIYTREPNENEFPIDTGNPTVLAEQGLYRGSTTQHSKKDYRIPVVERVYKNSQFNLLSSSRYSYFEIPELERINYEYLNVKDYDYLNVDEAYRDNFKVVDMLYTTKRAHWMD